MSMEPLEAARAVALRFLAYAPRSSAEIERRLERDEYSAEIIAAVIAELEALNYLNDAQFAQDWITDRADRKKYGKGRLKAELNRRGIDREFVQEAIDGVADEDELQRAIAAARPKWHPERMNALDSDTRQAEKRKIANFLQRRGFSWAIIKQVFAHLDANQE